MAPYGSWVLRLVSFDAVGPGPGARCRIYETSREQGIRVLGCSIIILSRLHTHVPRWKGFKRNQKREREKERGEIERER